ncbi:MAG: hypothetical protein GF346_05195, partial [Candidatus Eisenbacteria bacterium]|nr:hypothetical protein [Candidatus Latescibacterota bacterium]MBD3301822.1 hypothetical protein [Candidatus Eisenbacteria bacterium]
GAPGDDSVAVAWFDPRTGRSIPARAVAIPGTPAFAAPDDRDWVLHLRAR